MNLILGQLSQCIDNVFIASAWIVNLNYYSDNSANNNIMVATIGAQHIGVV